MPPRASPSQGVRTPRPRAGIQAADGDIRAPFPNSTEPEFARADLFGNISDAQVRALDAIAVARQLRAGQYLFHRGAPSPGLVYVASGCLSLLRPQADGSDFVIRVFRAGETFAEATLIPDGRAPANARAEAESRVLIFPRKELIGIIRADPQFALHLIASLSQRIHSLVDLGEARHAQSPRNRLMAWLVARLPRDGVVSCSVAPGLTMASLAAELGMRPETLSRQLARLSSEGLILRSGRRIDIPDVTKIRSAMSRFCSG